MSRTYANVSRRTVLKGVGVAAFWGASVLPQVSRPIYTAWLNQRLESATRATVLSMSGQMDALGQIVGGPAVGAPGLVSLRADLSTSAAPSDAVSSGAAT